LSKETRTRVVFGVWRDEIRNFLGSKRERESGTADFERCVTTSSYARFQGEVVKSLCSNFFLLSLSWCVAKHIIWYTFKSLWQKVSCFRSACAIWPPLPFPSFTVSQKKKDKWCAVFPCLRKDDFVKMCDIKAEDHIHHFNFPCLITTASLAILRMRGCTFNSSLISTSKKNAYIYNRTEWF